MRGPGGIAILLVGSGDGRAAPGDLFICLGRGQVPHDNGKPARGRVPGIVPVLKVFFLQTPVDGIGQG